MPGAEFPIRVGAPGPLKLEAKPGTYAVDGTATDLEGLVRGGENPIQVGRMITNAAGRAAVTMARGIRGQSEVKIAADRFIENIQLLADRCATVMRTNIGDLAGAFDDGQDWSTFDERQVKEAAGDDLIEQLDAMEGLVAAARELEARIAEFQRTYAAPVRVNHGSVRPLEREFVLQMKFMYSGFTSEKAPSSRTGPFARFLVAAWRDLGFDEVEDLEGVLGSYAQSL